jgi:AraC-like DNA-binding protein
MYDTSELGVLYTEHSRLRETTHITSLWSYETRSRDQNRPTVALTSDGSQEYWLERWDPLLNTMLPGTGVSLIVNLGDLWAAGRSLTTSALLPRVCVVGPVTQPRILRVGSSIRAVGAGFRPTLTPMVFNVPASELVDRIVPLEDLWTRYEVERLFESLSSLAIGRCVSTLRDVLMARIALLAGPEAVSQAASVLIARRGGRVSVADMAASHGLSRLQFSRRFRAGVGLPPKLFARITRFQSLVHALLLTDVSQWASMPSTLGYYDQAHMINEFRAFTGTPPTVFFRPQDDLVDPGRVQLQGRPSEWLRPAETATTSVGVSGR